jgi:hypothetical protein
MRIVSHYKNENSAQGNGMDALWNPTRHEKTGDFNWDESPVRDHIRQIVDAAAAIYNQNGGWPVDPRDLEDGMPDDQANCFYYGAAGNVWALRKLEVFLQHPMPLDLKAAAYRTYEISQTKPDSEEPGFLISRGGSELLAYAFGFDDAAGALAKSIEDCASMDQPKEIFWGPPAGLLMAYHAYQVRKDSRWLKMLLAHGQTFLENFGLEKRGIWQWPQVLYGAERPCIIGAAHGFVGAMLPFILAYEHLPPPMQNGIFDKLVRSIQETAIENDAYVNWPKSVGPVNDTSDLLLQWCHGAPGIVSCLSYLPGPYITSVHRLLEKAGEAIWSAGPLTKPSGLCHGTAGNAYAFLRLHSLSGEEKWLERARKFAMHAIAQSSAEYERKKSWHHSLLTGDLGLAVFLADCIVGSPGHFPGLESFAFDI